MAQTFSFPGFKTIEKYYKLNVYDNEMIKFFTDNNALTKDEYEQITGETYPEDTPNDEKA